ncbi:MULTISPECIES: histone-like nucleoid-structuring protein Lsr2 [Nonomuraea]|uniref:Lsr2 family protein n=2 Tax=Nonomuraea TaxID=83681 RepID=A0ABW1C8L0_9ACTN|nr:MULTISPECIES: Lsr2 family protein [Nonomuraea]MDA0645542.1 Lsr2 family protein [Nonomuraea ferruginea]TXK40242.1 Lsr2 family protein [Nonomuraea sp. C10]
MAKQIREIYIDDLDGSRMSSENVVKFGLDGVAYEIDLGEKNEEALRKALSPFITKARPVKSERAGRGRRGSGGAARALSREKSAEIRQWARAQGLPVSERGRIASSVVEKYEAAH